ncbi:hypothetical protein YA0089_27975 [Pseudomonas viridiflava]|uniref:hypothetical protein n=1 Tax=Pseudomonas viridiflava TaxID=33069 RepID=UPI0018E5FCC9|nr:hypothetical protein [Pseudomonas viridiflava]MBI6727460.1 hypothetical protein [Pseudomonas viridiflava]
MCSQTLGAWSLCVDNEDHSLTVTHADHPGKIEVLQYPESFCIPITGIEGIVVAEMNLGKAERGQDTNPWAPSTSEDGRYLYIPLEGGKHYLHIKADDEGFVVYAWNGAQNEVIDAVSATYAELAEEIEES